MATFHPPHSAGPGTYLELPDFKAYYGEEWNSVLTGLKKKLARLQIGDLTDEEWVTNINLVSSGSNITLSKVQENRMKGKLPKKSSAAVHRAIAEHKKFLPYTPPKSWQVVLSKVATTAIKTTATGAFAGAAAGLGQNAANSILGKDSMGFIDDIGAQFDQVSSLVKKGEGLYKQAKNFGGDYGNAGSTGIGTPAAPAPTASASGGIPGWVFVVGGVALAWVLLRK